jgi:hypothetical protein
VVSGPDAPDADGYRRVGRDDPAQLHLPRLAGRSMAAAPRRCASTDPHATGRCRAHVRWCEIVRDAQLPV